MARQVTQERQTPPRRWLQVLLAVSLSLNLAVLGLALGAHFREVRDGRHGMAPPERPMMKDAGLGPFLAALPPEGRAKVVEDLRARGVSPRPDYDRLAEELRQMLGAIRAEPFDPDALNAVLAAQRARAMARAEAGQAALVDAIAAMGPDERRAFADALEHRFSRAMTGHPMPHGPVGTPAAMPPAPTGN